MDLIDWIGERINCLGYLLLEIREYRVKQGVGRRRKDKMKKGVTKTKHGSYVVHIGKRKFFPGRDTFRRQFRVGYG